MSKYSMSCSLWKSFMQVSWDVCFLLNQYSTYLFSQSAICSVFYSWVDSRSPLFISTGVLCLYYRNVVPVRSSVEWARYHGLDGVATLTSYNNWWLAPDMDVHHHWNEKKKILESQSDKVWISIVVVGMQTCLQMHIYIGYVFERLLVRCMSLRITFIQTLQIFSSLSLHWAIHSYKALNPFCFASSSTLCFGSDSKKGD